MYVKVEEKRPNIERLAALSVGCQLVHQLSNDVSPIYQFFFGVCKKQSLARVRVML